MESPVLNIEENPPRLRVSVIIRLVAALGFTIPLIGAALSSLLLIRVFQAMKAAENAGIAAVMAGMKESAIPVNISLYLAALVGFTVIIALVVRALVETKTASPPFWFFAICGILCLVPAGLFWKAELLILEALIPGNSIGAGGLAAMRSICCMPSGAIASTSTPSALGLVDNTTASSPSACRTRTRASREVRAVKRLTFMSWLR